MNSNLFSIITLSIFLLLISCQTEERPQVSFYTWKSGLSFSESISTTLRHYNPSPLYMHYFDVDFEEEGNDIYPVYALKKVDDGFKDREIIPVVFVVNEVLKNVEVKKLSVKIRNLIHQISEHHFGKRHKKIQLDCDWTQSTRENYFQMIEVLSKYFEVDVTIRLHQIKYADRTGIPPVNSGTLMLYNIGELANENENSILESRLVEKYINTKSSYPLPLNLALPLFSQTVIKDRQNRIKLINHTDEGELSSNTRCFRKVKPNLYQVESDTLYKGFYLSEGVRLKLERVSENDIIHSYQLIRNSKLDISKVIFYHLDDATLKNVDLHKITSQL